MICKLKLDSKREKNFRFIYLLNRCFREHDVELALHAA